MKSQSSSALTSQRLCIFRRWALLLLLLTGLAWPARAQWITQTVELNPGWNAVYLHVTATHDTLENLVGALSPISEIWLWQPGLGGGRLSNPSQPVTGSDWVQWTKATGPVDALPLRANSAYLVRNSGSTPYSWNIKGKPVPPESRWTASGLNFIGFSTRGDSPPVFSNFLAPAQSSKPFDIFYYPGAEAAGASPNAAPLFAANTTQVKRGQAVWIKKQDNSENRYFGPFEVVLQDYRGLLFSDVAGAYSLRLKNQIAGTNTISLTLVASETSPAGDAIPTPPVLLRTARDTSTLTYGHTNLPVNEARTFVLAPKGTPGSEVEVVLGLDRANMAAPNGTLFAAVLRLQDTTLGHLQVDLPVSAIQASTEGLWVGSASITHVGNYLKTYAKATNAVDFANQLTQLTALNEANKTVSLPTGLWTRHVVASSEADSVAGNLNWKSIASSDDGTNLVAAVAGGKLYTSRDKGAAWVARESARDWAAVASSADGTNLVAVARAGRIYTSTDVGATWTARESDRDWTSIASSGDGLKLIAAVDEGNLHTSVDGGATWTERETVRAWVAVASSSDGTNLVAAVDEGQIYTSTDAGENWTAREQDREWTSVVSSADGMVLIASENGGRLYTSINGGADWAVSDADRNWSSIAVAGNGTNAVAAVSNGLLYTSTDRGITWVPRETERAWAAVASSADGTNLVAAAWGGRMYQSADAGVTWSLVGAELWSCVAVSADGARQFAAGRASRIFTSSDNGQTWTMQDSAPVANWQSIATAADGMNSVAVALGGQLYTSWDFGVTWTPRMSSANWQSVACAADGMKMAAAVGGGNIFTSEDAGEHWTARAAAGTRDWSSLALTPDGNNLLATVNAGTIYSSANFGLSWKELFGAPTTGWRSIAASADAKSLVAAAQPGGVYTSSDSGETWDLKASIPPGGNWSAVVSSTNGNALAAVESGGRIYTSSNAGANWVARESVRSWSAIACSMDGTGLLASEADGPSQLYTVIGDLVTPTLTYDTNSNLILSGGGKYLTAAFDTELGAVRSPFPLRLIVHQGSNGVTRLLQHVFVGPDATTTNTILALEQSKLHPAMLERARRITAVHLPLSNEGWRLNGEFGGVGIMNVALTEGFNNTVSNPFLHSYHPDHDNMDALFQQLTKPGAEAYDVKRQITLSFTPPGNDFISRTAGGSRMQGTYLENIVLKGGDSQTRTIVTKGNFLLNRITSIPTIQ